MINVSSSLKEKDFFITACTTTAQLPNHVFKKGHPGKEKLTTTHRRHLKTEAVLEIMVLIKLATVIRTGTLGREVTSPLIIELSPRN